MVGWPAGLGGLVEAGLSYSSYFIRGLLQRSSCFGLRRDFFRCFSFVLWSGGFLPRFFLICCVRFVDETEIYTVVTCEHEVV